ncbi:MAG: hypothetical protein HYR67_14660 [Bacteroidetes bacterium]|nr:hypothetical protein [Bacteroidota bacterium]
MIQLIILLLFSAFSVADNCDISPLTTECIKQMPRKFRSLKSFSLPKRKEGFIEYSYVLTKGTRYHVGACFNAVDNLKIEVFSSKRLLVATITSKKKYSKLTYKCASSGIYYMRFSCNSSDNSCGAGLLSFASKD